MMQHMSIRSRDTGSRVPFRLRPQQQRVVEMLKRHMERKRRLYAIFLKARRVGISTLASGLQIAHCAAKADSHAAIIAQTKEVSKELFQQACGFAKDIRYINPGIDIKNNKIFWPHQSALESVLSHQTAATIFGTRGLTLSSVHMTEAAFYPYDGAYKAILNTLSSADPDCVCLIETTANGMEGPGEDYYNYWTAAEAGENEFLPIFLPWFEDDAYVGNPEDAADAPRDDYERYLMSDLKDSETGKKIKLGKERIAWFRNTLETKCEGSLDVWAAEYPSTSSEAFVRTGNPAFSQNEIQFAEKAKMKPAHYGWIRENPVTGKPQFEPSQHKDDSLLVVWELPQPQTHYFLGVDTARGDLANKNPGDFAAIVGWNAETGAQACRYMSRVSPEELSKWAGLLGRFYNDACLNVEINNLGYVVMKELREKWYYPNQYRWKGRDDKFDGKPGTAFGFETTMRSRNMMLQLYRVALYRTECLPRDEVLVSQMGAVRMDGFRWEVIVGHDDVFVAAMIGWIAKEQFHPTKCVQRNQRNLLLTSDELYAAQIALTGQAPAHEMAKLEYGTDPSSTVFGALLMNSNDHLRKLDKYARSKNRPDRLLGV
jgi:hypothetical protein